MIIKYPIIKIDLHDQVWQKLIADIEVFSFVQTEEYNCLQQ